MLHSDRVCRAVSNPQTPRSAQRDKADGKQVIPDTSTGDRTVSAIASAKSTDFIGQVRHPVPALSAYAYQEASSLVPATYASRGLGDSGSAMPVRRRSEFDRAHSAPPRSVAGGLQACSRVTHDSLSNSSRVRGPISGTGKGGTPSIVSGCARRACR